MVVNQYMAKKFLKCFNITIFIKRNLYMELNKTQVLTDNLIIENISMADDNFLEVFYKEIKGFDAKIVDIINSKKLKIILANKLSDVLPQGSGDIETYQEDHPVNRDITVRGLCSDTIGSICVFFNTVTIQNIGAILYHEIGHLIDYYDTWLQEDCRPCLSTTNEFIESYRFCIAKYWKKIKSDKCFRLKHYIQTSTPENVSVAGVMETFAHCFARLHNKFDDIDIMGKYFTELLPVSEKIYNKFLDSWQNI